MAKKNATKKAAQVYEVVFNALSTNTFEGKIASIDDEAITLKYRKPRSPKFILNRIPITKIIRVVLPEGELAKGAKAEITIEAGVYDLDAAEGILVESPIPGLIGIQAKDGTVSLFDEDGSVILAEVDADASDAKAKPKAKPVVDDDDDEEDDESDEDEEEDDSDYDEEDEEEDEEPAPKKPVKKLNAHDKAEKKAKAKRAQEELEEIEEDDDEDWDE